MVGVPGSIPPRLVGVPEVRGCLRKSPIFLIFWEWKTHRDFSPGLEIPFPRGGILPGRSLKRRSYDDWIERDVNPTGVDSSGTRWQAERTRRLIRLKGLNGFKPIVARS
jgi:hypothetical protein